VGRLEGLCGVGELLVTSWITAHKDGSSRPIPPPSSIWPVRTRDHEAVTDVTGDLIEVQRVGEVVKVGWRSTGPPDNWIELLTLSEDMAWRLGTQLRKESLNG